MTIHPFPPVFSNDSKILILGSFPSVKSRETAFYYGNGQNRFWRVLSRVFNEPTPVSKEEKTKLILSHSLALWDVVGSCDIVGSADSSIKRAVPNDVFSLLEKTKIETVVTNGKTADRLYKKLLMENVGIEPVCLPSTSPANAAYSLEDLVLLWKIIAE